MCKSAGKPVLMFLFGTSYFCPMFFLRNNFFLQKKERTWRIISMKYFLHIFTEFVFQTTWPNWFSFGVFLSMTTCLDVMFVAGRSSAGGQKGERRAFAPSKRKSLLQSVGVLHKWPTDNMIVWGLTPHNLQNMLKLWRRLFIYLLGNGQ